MPFSVTSISHHKHLIYTKASATTYSTHVSAPF